LPLEVKGKRKNHVIAFARHLKGQWSITVVSRLLAKLGKAVPLGGRAWGNTVVELPDGAPAEWLNVFTEHRLSAPLPVSKLFEALPFALLQSPSSDR
jgi:(1->4)-alpha-D-glucan 1-alpha-D-glucosylmutase